MTYTHSMNVALICNVIGNWLRMNEKDLKVLVTCGLLHDIGKLRVPNDIITKPGKLTVQEYEIVKKHPQYGYEMLKDKNWIVVSNWRHCSIMSVLEGPAIHMD